MTFLAADAVTGDWLHRDVPLSGAEVTWGLNGGDALRGTVTPEIASLTRGDGRPLLDPWGTLIYYEESGQIRWGGIIVATTQTGADWEVEADGVAAYPRGIPYRGVYTARDIDPLDVVRDIWAHVQDQPDGDLGVVVDDTSSPVRIGGVSLTEINRREAEYMRERERQWRQEYVQAYGDWLAAEIAEWDAEHPDATEAEREAELDRLRQYYYGERLTTQLAQARTGWRRDWASMERELLRQGYSLSEWEAPDCGREIDTLAGETPFEYREEHHWVDDTRDAVAHRLRLGYPRLGRRQSNLRFVESENISEVVAVQRDGADFANEALALGSGEGRAMLRTRIPERDGRLRRVHVVTDKSVSKRARLNRVARRELDARRHLPEITRCVVWEHPHAPLGAYHVGDDILVEAHTGWAAGAAIWSRITGMTRQVDTGVTELTLARSDSYTYRGS